MVKTIVYYDCLCYIVFLNFHHERRHILLCLHGGKDQGADRNIGDPPPQERSRRLCVQRCKYATDAKQLNTQTAVIKRLIERNEGNWEQHQQRAQRVQINDQHQ